MSKPERFWGNTSQVTIYDDERIALIRAGDLLAANLELGNSRRLYELAGEGQGGLEAVMKRLGLE